MSVLGFSIGRCHGFSCFLFKVSMSFIVVLVRISFLNFCIISVNSFFDFSQVKRPAYHALSYSRLKIEKIKCKSNVTQSEALIILILHCTVTVLYLLPGIQFGYATV